MITILLYVLLIAITSVLVFKKHYEKRVTVNEYPFEMVVKNTSEGRGRAVLFGMNQYLLTENFGSSHGIEKIPTYNNSYLELLQRSASQPCGIDRIALKGKLNVVERVWTYLEKHPSGALWQLPIVTAKYITIAHEKLEKEFGEAEVTIDNLDGWKINGNTNFQFDIDGYSELKVSIYPKMERIVYTSYWIKFINLFRSKQKANIYAQVESIPQW